MAKKRVSKGATRRTLKGRKVKITHEGKQVEGINADFEVEKDAWSVYRLSDGTTVRIRIVVTDIVVTEEQMADGIPLVAVKYGTLVNAVPAETAVSRVKKKRTNDAARSHE